MLKQYELTCKAAASNKIYAFTHMLTFWRARSWRHTGRILSLRPLTHMLDTSYLRSFRDKDESLRLFFGQMCCITHWLRSLPVYSAWFFTPGLWGCLVYQNYAWNPIFWHTSRLLRTPRCTIWWVICNLWSWKCTVKLWESRCAQMLRIHA